MFIKNKRTRKKFSLVMEEIRTLGALCTMILFFVQLHYIRVQLNELTEHQQNYETTSEITPDSN